jgi:DNA-binding HxlR family transcriptional regulator/putative sterol carrier protein
VGERWALLIVRELVLGPRRFTDLRDSLAGASPNVLSQRLEDLQTAGVVQRHRLPPPAASWVYELTPWGYELDDVLLAMARWGSQSAAAAEHELSPRALLIAMRTTYAPAGSGDAAGRFELHIGDESFVVTTGQGSITVAAGRAPSPDAVIWSGPAAFRAVIFGDLALADALRSGALRIDGDDDVAAALLASFRRPRLATSPAQQPVRRSDR